MEKKEIRSILDKNRNGKIDTTDAIFEILHLFSVSKRFNKFNFLIGVVVGALIVFMSMFNAP